MTPAVKQTYQNLISALNLAVTHKCAAGIIPPDEAKIVKPLLEALSNERFHFEAEIWHDAQEGATSKLYPAEMLLRAYTPALSQIAPLEPITIIAENGLHHLLDKAIILSAVDQALTMKQMPISINTSARNMHAEDFWRDVSTMLDDHFPIEELRGNLTFEVTEDDLADNPCRETLLKIKDKYQCQFALDDFYHDYGFNAIHHSGTDSFDWHRLQNLKDVVDFVKIDGEIVEETLRSDSNVKMNDIISRVHGVAPNAHFVFERVSNANEALLLGTIVNGQTNAESQTAVQGRRLQGTREKFQEELTLAVHNAPHKPKGPSN